MSLEIQNPFEVLKMTLLISLISHSRTHTQGDNYREASEKSHGHMII